MKSKMHYLYRYCRRWGLGLSLVVLGAVSTAHAADPAKGSAVYQRHCASCHGQDGKPMMPGMPDFSKGERMMQADLALLDILRKGKGPMPAYQGLLSDDELLNVIAYIRTLR